MLSSSARAQNSNSGPSWRQVEFAIRMTLAERVQYVHASKAKYDAAEKADVELI